MAEEGNIASPATYGRLSERMYIHSRAKNFESITRGNLNRVKKGKGEGAKKLEREVKDLTNLIQEIMVKSNEFYKAMGIDGRDVLKSDGTADFAGASEFSRLYLMDWTKNTNNSTLTEEQKLVKSLLSIINTRKMQNFIEEQAQKIVPMDTQKISRAFNKFNKYLTDEGREAFLDTTEKVTFAMLNQAVEDIVTQETGKKRKLSSSVNREALERSYKKSQEKLGKDVNNNKNTGLNELVEHAKQQIITPLKAEKLAMICSTYVINELKKIYNDFSYIESKYQNINNFKKMITDSFKSGFLQYRGGATFKKNDIRVTGFLLEFGMQIAYTPFLSTIGASIQTIGQDTEKKIYKTVSFNQSTGELTAGEYSFNAQKAADLVITTKDNKTYHIQAKNSFSNSNYLTVNLKESFKLSYFLENALSNPKLRYEYAYLILNKSYLELNNIELNRQTNEFEAENYKSSSKIEEIISFLMAQTVAFLTSSELGGYTKHQKTATTGNLFFVYQGKYLIPISMFLVSALQFSKQLAQGVEQDKLQYIGGFRYNKRLLGISRNISNAKNFRQAKMAGLSQGIQDGAYEKDDGTIGYKSPRYPDPMVAIGALKGRQLYADAYFSRINFTPNISKIRDVLKYI